MHKAKSFTNNNKQIMSGPW